MRIHYRSFVQVYEYLTIRPRGRMDYESIAHEAVGRMDYLSW